MEGKATAGLEEYLLDTYGVEVCRICGLVIGYDTRNNSEYFSRPVANMLSGIAFVYNTSRDFGFLFDYI